MHCKKLYPPKFDEVAGCYDTGRIGFSYHIENANNNCKHFKKSFFGKIWMKKSGKVYCIDCRYFKKITND